MWKSEGHRLLALDSRSSADIADALQITAHTVRGWRNDGNMPRRGPIRVQLEQLGICHRRAWEMPAQALLEQAQNTQPQPKVPVAPPQAFTPVNPLPAEDRQPAVQIAEIDHRTQGWAEKARFEQVERARQDLERARNGGYPAPATEIVKLEEAYSKALERAERAAGKLRAIDEHRMTKTVTWRRFMSKLKSALEPYPDALEAVIEALKQ